jgi:tetratricopeptide (TPR) repeat protein
MRKLNSIIIFLIIVLFSVSPLLFSFKNSELFEIPKMYFVYCFTSLTLILHLINVYQGKKTLFAKHPLNPFLLFFIFTQTIATFNSIDPHTSLFGYYSRLNGGLLSLISYFLIFQLILIYFNKKQKEYLVYALLFSGLIVSIYGLLQHFGVDKHIWIQKVQERVFSTFGQPNWLAAFLCVLIPLALHQKKIIYNFFSIIFFICLLYTKSKSGIIASLISIFIYYLLNFIYQKNTWKKAILPIIAFTLLSCFIANPIKDQFSPKKTTISTNNLNYNITDSGNIRKIVWRGAINLFKKFPSFGTGVETFAYSYYWTRPVEHNLTSEWNHLYNKAHNEYINYLATTGLVGFIAYLLLIIATIYYLIKQRDYVILASYFSILITNFFGFSTVIISLLFYSLPALNYQDIQKPSTNYQKNNKLLLLIIPFIIFSLIKTISFYKADKFYALAQNYDNVKNYEKALMYISKSIKLNPYEPIYYSKKAHLSARTSRVDQAVNAFQKAISISPFNLNILKENAQTFYFLSTIDGKYFTKSLEILEKIIKLAPTDAKAYLTTANFLQSANFINESIPFYLKALELKPNYDDASYALALIHLEKKNYSEAKKYLEITIKIAPKNLQAQEYLNQL